MTSLDSKAVEKALWDLEAGREKKAFLTLKRLAEAGNKAAFPMLGYLYDVGQGTWRDPKLAMHWYMLGYRSGSATCASNIATVYRDAGNARREFEWYQRAVALGDGDAKLELAIRLLSGKGVRRNRKAAIVLLKEVLANARDTSEAARDTARQLLWGCETKRRVA